MLPPDFQEYWAKILFFIFAFVMVVFGRVHACDLSIEKGLISSDGQVILLQAIEKEFNEEKVVYKFRRIQCFKSGSICILAFEKPSGIEKCVLHDIELSSRDDLDSVLTKNSYKQIIYFA